MRPETLIHALFENVSRFPDRPALTQFDANLSKIGDLTYAELLSKVENLSSNLSDVIRPGSTALVAQNFGIDYVVSVLAVMSMGGVPIPAMPATRRSADRLNAMLRIGRPAVLLHDGINEYTSPLLANTDAHAVYVTDRLTDRNSRIVGFAPRGDDTALLQFTSGSTATPKAVVLTHANIAANERAIAKEFDHEAGVRLLGWLPLFHDMGLIGNVFQPLYMGGTALMLAPLDVVSRPTNWLKMIELTRAQTSGGPNFIYDLCVRKVSDEVTQTLDLSSWRVAYNGSEPVRRHTLERFAQKFKCAGFAPTSLFPCYGLAEASLLVTGRRFFREDRGGPLVPGVDSSGTLISCGSVRSDTEVVVVDPTTLEPVDDGERGEIFITGPSVASAYLDANGIQNAPFKHRIPGKGSRAFHRTGDLGKIERGELFVVGRDKDVIKVRGANHHAEDMESLIERDCPLIDDHSVCVVGVSDETGSEAVAAIVEIPRSIDASGRLKLFTHIREALSLNAGVAIEKVYFVNKGALHRTSSGKFARSACREGIRSGNLKFIEKL